MRLSLGILILSGLILASAARKKTVDWSKVDFDELEEQWKDGDEEDELRTDGDILYEEMEKRKAQKIDLSKPVNPDELRHSQSMAGPAMMFIELEPKEGNYQDEEMTEFAVAWRDLLFTGGVQATFYNLDDHKMLVSLQKGWEGQQVRDFLLDQPEVNKVVWDSVDYHPEKTVAQRQREVEALRAPKKEKPKKKNKKAPRQRKRRTEL